MKLLACTVGLLLLALTACGPSEVAPRAPVAPTDEASGPPIDDTDDTDEPPVDDTEPPVDDTEPPVDDTEPPVDDTEPPVDDTEPPLDDTEPPVDDSEPPVDVPPPADETGGGPLVEEAPPPSCSAVVRPPRPATCPFAATGANEIVVWGQEGWNALGDAIAADLSPCTDAFISIPPVTADKTQLRAGQAALMRARGPQMHAMAEFHFTTWNQTRNALGLTWLEVGRRFRDEMEAKGYCVEAGDTWAINEAPSSIRKDAAFRVAFAELLRGLSEGRAGMPVSKGALFITGMGNKTTNVSVYKSNLKTWLADTTFWTKANNALRFFGQEVYVDPMNTCLGATAQVDRRRRVNDFAMHFMRLAAAGPDSVNTAQSFLSRAYVPTMNAVWGADPERGYGDTTITLDNMRKHIRMQTDATRSYADAHTSPDGRIGFAFGSYHDPDEWQALAVTVADAVRGAYGAGASAAGACAAEGCACDVDGAAANNAWAALGTW